MQYLKGRGITDKSLPFDHRIGFANGTLMNVLPNDAKITGQLNDLGILNASGKEHFYGCLTLISFGFKNTIPCYGTNGLTASHIKWLTQTRVETVYICFDADEAGQAAMPVVGERLTQAGITTHPVTLPNGQDINDFFLLTVNPKEAFNALLGQANPAAKKENGQKITKTDFGFTMAVADRRYEVRGISKKGGASSKPRLRVLTLKSACTQTPWIFTRHGPGPFFSRG